MLLAMTSRWLWFVLVGLLPGSARADETKDEDVAFSIALAKPDTAYLAKAVAVPFHAVGLTFRSSACTKAFSGDKTITDKKQLAELAKCFGELELGELMVEQPPLIEKLDDSVAADVCTSNLVVGDYEVALTMRLGAAHPYKITGLKLTPLEGELNGTVGDPSPMCARHAAPPPSSGQDVAPGLLEKNRLSGTATIPPDAAMTKAINASGKTTVVGSWKLCIDDAGAVTTVTRIKATGFPAYDHALEAAMRKWTYKPFHVIDKPVPVCTEETLVYRLPPSP